MEFRSERPSCGPGFVAVVNGDPESSHPAEGSSGKSAVPMYSMI